MSSITLLRGENLWALTEECLRWIREFRARHGPENLIRRTVSPDVPLRDLLDDVAAAPFIAPKRLVVFEGIPVHIEREGVQAIERAIHPDCVLLVVEPKPDRRYASVREFLKIAAVRAFPILTGKALRAWVLGVCREHGTSIAGDALEELLANCGDDQSLLAAEVPKLALAAGDRPIRRELVSLLSPLSGDREVWELSRRIAAGDARGALSFVRALLAQGNTPLHRLWAHLLWIIESLVTLSVCVREGGDSSLASAQRLGVPFATARSLLPLASSVPLERVEKLLESAAGSDCSVKTGGIRVTADALEELVALVEKTVVELATLRTSAVSS